MTSPPPALMKPEASLIVALSAARDSGSWQSDYAARFDLNASLATSETALIELAELLCATGFADRITDMQAARDELARLRASTATVE